MNPFIARTPEPPYYAVIFSNTKTANDHGYSEMAAKMENLASEQPGYLGIESISDSHGKAITISYWESEESIRSWKQNTEHLQAQQTGKTTWYEDYAVRIAKVERAYSMHD